MLFCKAYLYNKRTNFSVQLQCTLPVLYYCIMLLLYLLYCVVVDTAADFEFKARYSLEDSYINLNQLA